jgi:asparagine synthase (glutamine-hydrolysing)
MPQGLHAHADIPRQLARKEVSAFVANLPRESSSTFFQGVSRVPPGQLIRIRRGRVEARSYWRLPVHQIYFPKQSDYIDAFREQLDRATKVRLRGAGSRVGAHLSAGLDSGAVASTAAHIMARTGEKVVAFTSAPRAGFNGPTIPGRIGDESEIAAEVVARYPNMEHVIVRTGGASPLDIIGAQAELFQEPVGHPCNFVWWSAVHEEAQARGLSVMLTGEAGNLTISSGGLPMLAEFVRARRWAQWLREARSIVGASASWRGVLAMSFGPWVPAPLWRILLSSFAASGGGRRPQLLHPSLRSGLESRANAAARSGPPNKDDRQTRWELLQQHEPGNFRKGVLAKWGIDERDPTADRRVAEFCLALPAEQLFSGGITRRLARLALADRLPNSVINGVRGYQYPDWYERIDKESLERTLSELEAGPMASLLLDFDELRELVSTWPSEDQWGAIDKIAIYRLDFLMALSAGAFANRVCQ